MNNPDPVSGLFGFEAFMERALDHMPMSVRMNLDLCGVKLSRAQWCGLPLAVRQVVLEMRCGTSGERQRLRCYLEFTVEAFRLGPLVPVLCDARGWDAQSPVPATVASALHSLALPRLSGSAWAGLDKLQRFALIKLCGDASSRKLQAALREFGLGGSHPEPAAQTAPAAGRTEPPVADSAGTADPLTAAGTGADGGDALVFAFVARTLGQPQCRRFERPADGAEVNPR